jgi:hypothetical protein
VIETMKNMAGQVAIALENARLFQEAQQVIRELRTVQQQYLLDGWSGFSQENENLEYRIGDEEDDNSRKLEVPISLRDQVLGTIMLNGQGEWTPDQQSCDAVATQALLLWKCTPKSRRRTQWSAWWLTSTRRSGPPQRLTVSFKP